MERRERSDGGGRFSVRLNIFYADDGLIAPTKSEWLQGFFNALMGMFKRVGLRTNMGKGVGMISQS